MRRFLPRLLTIGADPADSLELRLRKALLLSAVAMIVPAGLLWGAMYWIGATVSALIPWTYVVIAIVFSPHDKPRGLSPRGLAAMGLAGTVSDRSRRGG